MLVEFEFFAMGAINGGRLVRSLHRRGCRQPIRCANEEAATRSRPLSSVEAARIARTITPEYRCHGWDCSRTLTVILSSPAADRSSLILPKALFEMDKSAQNISKARGPRPTSSAASIPPYPFPRLYSPPDINVRHGNQTAGDHASPARRSTSRRAAHVDAREVGPTGSMVSAGEIASGDKRMRKRAAVSAWPELERTDIVREAKELFTLN